MAKAKPLSGKLPVILGRRIQERRLSLGLTQGQLAEAVGVDPETISRIERGAVVPGLARFEQIASALKTSMPSLLANVTSSPDDLAAQISPFLKNMDESDRMFVFEFVKRFADHRKPKKR